MIGAAGGGGRALISCRRLGKNYRVGEMVIPALSDVSLDIAAGELVAIMGPSGSGKSTLMHLIGALDVPSAGKLVIDGRNVGELSTDELADLRNETIGFVFQQFNLLPRTAALDNVKLPLLYARRRRADADARARACLEQVDLADRLDHQPSQLSGGEQQRVAIARALVNEPKILLADEPTGALDTQTSDSIMRLLRRLNDGGITVVLVTHEPDVAAHAGRVVRLRDGRVVEEDWVAERTLT
jgi:putative ABC transport system ATP-binding protein